MLADTGASIWALGPPTPAKSKKAIVVVSVSDEGDRSKLVVPGLQTSGKVLDEACVGVEGLGLLELLLLPAAALALALLVPLVKMVSLSRMRRLGLGLGAAAVVASWACRRARSLFFCSAKMRSVSASSRATSSAHCSASSSSCWRGVMAGWPLGGSALARVIALRRARSAGLVASSLAFRLGDEGCRAMLADFAPSGVGVELGLGLAVTVAFSLALALVLAFVVGVGCAAGSFSGPFPGAVCTNLRGCRSSSSVPLMLLLALRGLDGDSDTALLDRRRSLFSGTGDGVCGASSASTKTSNVLLRLTEDTLFPLRLR